MVNELRSVSIRRMRRLTLIRLIVVTMASATRPIHGANLSRTLADIVILEPFHVARESRLFRYRHARTKFDMDHPRCLAGSPPPLRPGGRFRTRWRFAPA